MNTITGIYDQLDLMTPHISSCLDFTIIIDLLKAKLLRLEKKDETLIIEKFNFEMCIDALPFISHSLNFFKCNTINLPIKFQEDLVFKYICGYEQIISSTEDIFVNHKRYDHPLKELIS